MPLENSFTHNVGTGGYILPGKKKVVILGSPTLVALGINVYDSLGECARKRNLSVQDVGLPDL